MKITVDTNKKTIVVHGRVGICTVVNYMRSHFKSNWKQYKISSDKIKTETTINNWNYDMDTFHNLNQN